MALANFDCLLQSLDGVIYITDFSGAFLACGNPNWINFALANGADHLVDTTGMNALTACSDEETAGAYRLIYEAIRTGRIDSYSFGFRCDTPRIRREMRMSLTKLVTGGETVGIVHHSICLAEDERPVIGIFENFSASENCPSPILRVCSYCLRVQDQDPEIWMEPEQYYREGGGSDVNISHGICPSCYSKIVLPIKNIN